MKTLLACPTDGTSLSEQGNHLECPACRGAWPIQGGVSCFLPATDAFYEGTYRSQIRYLPPSEGMLGVWPLWLLNCGYVWEVRRRVPAGSTVLEFGCAGGVRYFGKRYKMIGCDVSLTSLQAAVGSYEALLQSSATDPLPLPSASVDAIVSCFFWEHMLPSTKLGILAECCRVLRPGGHLIFLYDVETENPIIAPLKRRNPGLYRQLFCDGDGHVGYETREANLVTFRAGGLVIEEERGLEATPIQSPSVYAKLARVPAGFRKFFDYASRLGEAPWNHPWTLLVRATDVTVGRFVPRAWARVAMVVCRRPPDSNP